LIVKTAMIGTSFARHRHMPSMTTDSPVDTAQDRVLERAEQPERHPTRRTPRKVNDRKQFSLLVVRGDGARVFRLNVPRRLPLLVLVALLVGSAVLSAVMADWWHLRQRMHASASLFQQIQEQQTTIDSFNRRVTELRREISSWRELHTRIWEAFGPETSTRGRVRGMGGTTGIPDGVVARVGPTDEVERLAESVQAEGESLRALDSLVARARKVLAALPTRWPVRGSVNSEFGTRLSPWTRSPEFHAGLDIAADRGTVVRAPSKATVAHAGPHGEYGIAVILDHGHDIRTVYGHLSRVAVRVGQAVDPGTELGLTGNTGRSSGPHLHYEILVKGQPVNPRSYLWN
jgi:murein DD-endopeptidase MepM/ murein hydrolase activator NlpD